MKRKKDPLEFRRVEQDPFARGSVDPGVATGFGMLRPEFHQQDDVWFNAIEDSIKQIINPRKAFRWVAFAWIFGALLGGGLVVAIIWAIIYWTLHHS